jgi:hypothetical protein
MPRHCLASETHQYMTCCDFPALTCNKSIQESNAAAVWEVIIMGIHGCVAAVALADKSAINELKGNVTNIAVLFY